MKTATIRQLRNDTNTLLDWIAQGETIIVTKRRKPVARLTSVIPADSNIAVPAPNFRVRNKRIFPHDETHKFDFSEMLAEQRE
jgi:prevent-host-death family protein